MKMTKKQYKDLSQLDRIEYKQQEILIENYYIYFLLFITISFVLVIIKTLFSVVIILLALLPLYKLLMETLELERKYFKVVKK